MFQTEFGTSVIPSKLFLAGISKNILAGKTQQETVLNLNTALLGNKVDPKIYYIYRLNHTIRPRLKVTRHIVMTLK